MKKINRVCVYVFLASNESFVVPHLPRTQLSGALSYMGHNIKFKEVFNWAVVT